MKENLRLAAGVEGFARHIGRLSSRLVTHHHDELEVNLVVSGRAAYLFGSQRVPLRTGSMIWLFPAQEHVLIDWSSDFSMWVVVFSPSLVKLHARDGNRPILRSSRPADIFCREIDTRSSDRLGALYDDILREEKDPEFINTALGYALVASWKAYQLSDESMPRTDVHPAVARAARLVAEAEGPVSLNQLSRKVGLSAPRLSRLFKRQTGVSLTVYRQRKCVRQFLRIYRNGARYSLTEAALQAGFGSYPQFHRVFRKTMGQSPAAYRKSLLVAAAT